MDSLLTWIGNNKEFAYTVLAGVITAIVATVAFIRRRRSAPRRILKNLESSMSDLFNEMQTDLKDHPLIREFYVLSFKNQPTGFQSKPRFAYNPADIPELAAKVGILASHGLVQDVTPSNVPIYCMMEPFAAYLGERRGH